MYCHLLYNLTASGKPFFGFGHLDCVTQALSGFLTQYLKHWFWNFLKIRFDKIKDEIKVFYTVELNDASSLMFQGTKGEITLCPSEHLSWAYKIPTVSIFLFSKLLPIGYVLDNLFCFIDGRHLRWEFSKPVMMHGPVNRSVAVSYGSRQTPTWKL